jgi:hypothetical protein
MRAALLPVVFGAAVSEHKLAPLSLAAGIALSFTGVGLFIALVGFSNRRQQKTSCFGGERDHRKPGCMSQAGTKQRRIP